MKHTARMVNMKVISSENEELKSMRLLCSFYTYHFSEAPETPGRLVRIYAPGPGIMPYSLPMPHC